MLRVRFFVSLRTAAFVVLLGAPSLAAAQTAPSLGAAESFAVLAGSTVTNTGSSTISGDAGVSPGSAVTGFPPGVIVNGTTHAADATALAAQTSTTSAYVLLAGQACTMDLTGQDLGGMVLTPGVYCFSTSAQLTGTLTLNAQGNSAAVFIFKTGSTITTASNSSVVMINGGVRCNVFWQIGSSATLGTGTSFAGNILALTSITLNTGAGVFNGRTLARNGAVTLDTNTVTLVGCAVTAPPAPPAPAPVPTLPQAFVVLLAIGLFVVGYMRLRRRSRVE
jgi:Ice-binding-like